jgi:hypothetical protein
MGVQKGKSGAIHSHINIKKLVSAVNCMETVPHDFKLFLANDRKLATTLTG